MGKGTHRVNWKDQLCYEYRIPEIDNGTIFQICCDNFNIEKSPSTPFEDEIVVRTVVAAPQDPERGQTTALRESFADVSPNVNGGILQEIIEIRKQGIDEDDDNDPAPENNQKSAPATYTIDQWVTPTIFSRRPDV